MQFCTDICRHLLAYDGILNPLFLALGDGIVIGWKLVWSRGYLDDPLARHQLI